MVALPVDSSDTMIQNPVVKQVDSSVETGRKQAYEFLHNGLNLLNISLEDDVINRCLDHANTLVKWNRVHNLSAIRRMDDILVKHLLDSFSILKHVQGKDIIDIGSGAGFPGIPIALAKSDSQVVLLDSNMKKTEFLRHSVALLGLSNVTVLCDRVQNQSNSCKYYDTVLVRALGSLREIAECGLPILKTNGCILAMKGRYPTRELENLRKICDSSIHELMVPGLNQKRHLVVLKRKTN